MTKTIAIQMDPIETVDIDTDSSFVLALEAQERGYIVFHYQPENLAFTSGLVTARARTLTLRREKGNHFIFGEPQIINLSNIYLGLVKNFNDNSEYFTDKAPMNFAWIGIIAVLKVIC